jgi:hypothetical protein
VSTASIRTVGARSHSVFSHALTATARVHGLTAFDVRLLLALAERGGRSRSDQLEADLLTNGTSVRRSLLTLRPFGMVKGGDKRGHREPIELLPDGELVVNAFCAMLARLRGVDDGAV